MCEHDWMVGQGKDKVVSRICLLCGQIDELVDGEWKPVAFSKS